MTTYLSTHFSLAEAIASDSAARKGIDNTPSPEVIAVMKKTALKLEQIRSILESSISINSWHRCLALNRFIGSSDKSAHVRGEAVDFISPRYGTPLAIARKLLEYKDLLDWDQLIYEHTWIHIAWNSDPARKNRRQVLTLLSNNSYAVGILERK